ncbi:MAG: transketolase C-terminal domain-containing protein [Eubacteriales bacterium]|nr:transketolase C-terminal domain-containing protein [Eubacteriales bacterium]
MSVNIYDKIKIKDNEMRFAFCESLIDLASRDERIMLLDCDLMSAMGTIPFKERFPERVIDCGIQEANMFGIAAGLSASGKIPFAHTFGVFASRRALDQIFMSCAYAGQNVKIVGSDPGICAALNGGTHMAFDDLGIMRNIPEMTVIEPTDTLMLRELMPVIAKKHGCVYMRLVRRKCESIYRKGTVFTLGKANVLRDGIDVGIIAMGYCVGQSLIAADLLKGKGISARVVDMFTLKPADREETIRTAKKTGVIITAENHQINNALGSTVAEILAEECPTPMVRVGVHDMFGEVGERDYLAERFELNADAIVKAALRALERNK